jgi:hypothetical protein
MSRHHIFHGEKNKCLRNFDRESRGEGRKRVRFKRLCEDNIKADLSEIICEVMIRFELANHKVQKWKNVKVIMNTLAP